MGEANVLKSRPLHRELLWYQGEDCQEMGEFPRTIRRLLVRERASVGLCQVCLFDNGPSCCATVAWLIAYSEWTYQAGAACGGAGRLCESTMLLLLYSWPAVTGPLRMLSIPLRIVRNVPSRFRRWRNESASSTDKYTKHREGQEER